MIIIPNSRLADSVLINYSLPEPELTLKFEVGVSYDSELEKVEEVAIDVAKKVLKEILDRESTEELFVRFQSFDSSSINFTVFMKVKDYRAQYLVRHEYIKRLHRRFKEEGIEIPFPTRTVYLRK